MIKDSVNKIIRNRTAQNAGWLIGGKVAQMLLSLIVGILTARYLGPSNYGLIGYGTAYMAFFMSLCTLGINSLLVKEFVDNPNGSGMVIGTTLVLKFIASTISFLLILLITFFVDYGEYNTILIVFLCNLGLVFHILETFNYWFQSRLQSKVTAIVTFIAYFSTSLYKIVLLLFNADVFLFALASSVDYVVLGLLLWRSYKKHGGQQLFFSREYAKGLLSRSIHFIFPGLMVAIYAQTDKFMLKQMMSTEAIGFYTTAQILGGMWTFVLSAIIDSLYPGIMNSYKNNSGFEEKNMILYRIVFYLSIIVSTLICLFARPIIGILYGEAYLSAVLPLQIVTWLTGFSFLGVARNAWIVCKNMQKHLIIIYVSAAIFNVIFNYLLIPTYGATGAAIASVVTQFSTVFIIPLGINGLRENTLLIIKAISFQKPT